MPILLDLETNNISLITEKNDAIIQLVKMEQLEKISVSQGSLSFLESLIIPQLKSAKINHLFEHPNQELNFLKSSKLESLEISTTIFEGIFKTKRKFDFKLKKLSIVGNTSKKIETNGNFSEFLNSQAENLEELEPKLFGESEEICETIFINLSGLRSLKINGNIFPSRNEFYIRLKPLESLKELIIFEGFTSETAKREILRNCPNLESTDDYLVRLIHLPIQFEIGKYIAQSIFRSPQQSTF